MERNVRGRVGSDNGAALRASRREAEHGDHSGILEMAGPFFTVYYDDMGRRIGFLATRTDARLGVRLLPDDGGHEGEEEDDDIDDGDEDDGNDDDDNATECNADTPSAIPCPNSFMCGTWGIQEVFNCHGGRCYPCNLFLGENVEILPDGAEVEDCAICLSEKTARCKLPQCTHRLCGVCAKRILLMDDSDQRCPICRRYAVPAWKHTGGSECRCARCGGQQGALAS